MEKAISPEVKEERQLKKEMLLQRKADINRKLQVRQLKYFKHWRDYELLTCILALIGLIIAVVEYEAHFEQNFNAKPEYIIKECIIERMIITLSTLLAVISLFIRYWLFTFWIDYKSSQKFYYRLTELQKKVEYKKKNNYQINIEDESDNEDDDLYRSRFRSDQNLQVFLKIILSWNFIFEFIILIIHPLPIEKEFTFYIIDMLSTKSQLLPANYKLSDFLLAFMFLRVYFLLKTLINLTIYSDLYAKKIAVKHQIKGNTTFCLKALNAKHPALLMSIMCTISVIVLAYLLRIFERVYYRSQGMIVFDNYFTAIWCVIITMTTVGYGDIFAVSPFGRIISIIIALWGTFLISLMVGSIQDILNLTEQQKQAVVEITNMQRVGASIKQGLQYFYMKKDLQRGFKIPDKKRNDYVYSKNEVLQQKQNLIKECYELRKEKQLNKKIYSNEETRVEKDVKVVKNQILDLNDKFNYLLYIAIKGKLMNVETDLNENDNDFFGSPSSVRNSSASTNFNMDKYQKMLVQFNDAAQKSSIKQESLNRWIRKRIPIQERLQALKKDQTMSPSNKQNEQD